MPVYETAFIDGTHKDLAKLKKVELRQLGHALATIHYHRKRRFDPGFTSFGKYKGTHLTYFNQNLKETITRHKIVCENDSLVQQSLELLKRSIDTRLFFRKTFSLIHGDIGYGNVVWGKNEIRFIDWSDGRYADPADELSYVKAINNISQKNMEVLLEGYSKMLPDPDVIKRIPMYELKNRIFDVVWASRKVANSTTSRDKKLYQQFYDVRAKNLKTFMYHAQAI